MLAHGTGLCYIEEAFHAFYKEALGLTKLSARERARMGLLALVVAAAALFFYLLAVVVIISHRVIFSFYQQPRRAGGQTQQI